MSGDYSEDEDSDTEEYKEAKSQSVPTAQQPNAIYLFKMFLLNLACWCFEHKQGHILFGYVPLWCLGIILTSLPKQK